MSIEKQNSRRECEKNKAERDRKDKKTENRRKFQPDSELGKYN